MFVDRLERESRRGTGRSRGCSPTAIESTGRLPVAPCPSRSVFQPRLPGRNSCVPRTRSEPLVGAMSPFVIGRGRTDVRPGSRDDAGSTGNRLTSVGSALGSLSRPSAARTSDSPTVRRAATLRRQSGRILRRAARCLRVPQQVVVRCRSRSCSSRRSSSSNDDLTDEVLAAEHLVQQRPNQMHVLVADLHEDAPALGQQFAGDDEPVAEVRQVGVDAELPGVAERLDLLRLARGVLGLAVLDVALAGGDLPVASRT